MRIEKQLREQTSLAKLGEMAAVIAHEVKNPLAGVRAAIQIIGTRLPKDSKDAPIVGEIVSRIDALNELMKDLLLFARPPQPKLALVDIETLVMSTAHLLGAIRRSGRSRSRLMVNRHAFSRMPSSSRLCL